MLARSTIVMGVLAILTCGLAGCGGDPPARLSHDLREIRVLDGDCDGGADRPCATFAVDYPEFAGTTDELAGAATALNRAVLEMLVAPESDRPASRDTLDAMAREFVEGWLAMREEFPDSASGARWFSNRTVEVIHRNDRVVTVRLERSEYTGGAHPNSVVELASYSLPAGTRVTLPDVLIEGHEAALTELAERTFRTTRAIAPDADLSAEGYWFEGGRFTLPSNFAVEPDGLRFHYDPYEIAPYATGPIEFVIAVEDLVPVLRQDRADWFTTD